MSIPRVEAVLWDADGVLQHDPPPWPVFFAEPLGERAGPIGDEIFADLRPALLGQVDVRARVAEVLARHGLGDRLEPVLAAWRAIEPLPESRRLVAGLVEAGVACHLATNQDDWRAAVMREQMGYADLLDRSYYSCDLGLAKPDPAYFTHVLTDLDLPAERVAFVDDRLPNVEGAASVGIHAVHWHHTDGLDALTDGLAALGLELDGSAT